MRIIERDYRYLLENLIPLNRLLPIRRRKISEVLKEGDTLGIRREAVLALEELVRSSYLNRDNPIVEKDSIRVAYTRSSGYYRFLLKMPLEEWRRMGAFPVDSKYEKENGGAVEGLPSTSSVEALPEIIKTFSINESNGSILQKLEKLIEKLSMVFLLPELKLYLAKEKIGESNSASPNIVLLSLDELKKNPITARMFSTGFDGSTQVFYNAARSGGLATGETKIMVPLIIVGETWGVLESTLKSESLRESSEVKISMAVRIVQQMIINNMRLENLIYIDKLTGVYNRHFYDVQLPIEIERATRSGTRLSMLVIDIDDFKRINDTLGHKKGDSALEIVAELIRRNLRKIDLAFRYGGEEFAILLPGTGQMEALHTAERLRSKISEYDEFKDQVGRQISITVSIGVAVFPDNASNAEELFIKADKAMLKAKKMGKNRIEVLRE